MMIHDQAQRERALDIRHSFIVQAPAGSGKTELLVRRYLALLAHAKKYPEEILAITFTRKAATEMRHRVLNALMFSQSPEPDESHLLETWQLAKKAMEKNQHLNWQLLENPNRLRIQTIDSFCYQLVQQMPISQDFLLQASLTEDASGLYRQAARSLLRTLEEDTYWAEKLADLLLHLDNYHLNAENLFCEMLRRRDQWLPHIIPFRQQSKQSQQTVKHILELSLKNLCLDHLDKCFHLMPKEYSQQLTALLRFAATELPTISTSFPEELLICQNLEELPTAQLDYLPQWQAIAKFLLTADFKWRKQVNKNQGFAAKTPQKEAMQHLLSALESHEDLRSALENILLIPQPFYTDQQWIMVESLVEILPVLVAQLKTIFNQEHTVDYVEISLNALQALGHEDEPSDLAIYLDQQIQHILVDEFQDTSISQFKLLQKLTSAWHPQDHRSLFLVGDPMQSIYRFREAEVGLFLKVQQEGLDHISLTSLQLSCNFRSDPQLVTWVNEQFQTIFPLIGDITTGAIPFSASQAMNPPQKNSGVFFHAHLDLEDEATTILEIINNERTKDPENSICILVRAKSHLAPIIQQLKAAKVPFSAVEIESLIHQPVILDLLSLSKALLHLSDRIAWLAILRAPWLGLSLNDLLALSNWNLNKTIWSALQNHQKIPSLSKHAQQRLPHFVDTLSQIFQNRQRLVLSDWIQWAWLALGGISCLQETQLKNAQDYFELLREFEKNSSYLDITALEEKLAKSFSSPEKNQDQRLQLMTIHKAKGLEFDIVILASLERKAPYDKTQLLLWLDRPRSLGENNLILAPIKAKEEEKDPIYDYIRRIERSKSDYEASRLLYVALTRAKKNLHLTATLSRDKKDPETLNKPQANSFLDLLWPYAETFFLEKVSNSIAHSEANSIVKPKEHLLKRLPSSWSNPIVFENAIINRQQFSQNYSLQWINPAAKHVGILIHKILQQISIEGVDVWDVHTIERSQLFWEKELRNHGLSPMEVKNGLIEVKTAVANILADQKGRWILYKHEQAQSEYQFVVHQNNKFKQYIVDRTFIDTETNTRWIIDYKTSTLSSKELNAEILAQYWCQLDNYAFALSLNEELPIKLGLYFPLTMTWLEKNYSDTPVTEAILAL